MCIRDRANTFFPINLTAVPMHELKDSLWFSKQMSVFTGYLTVTRLLQNFPLKAQPGLTSQIPQKHNMAIFELPRASVSKRGYLWSYCSLVLKMRVLELGNGLLADKWSELNKLGVKLSPDSFSYTAIFIFPLYIIFKKTSFNSSQFIRDNHCLASQYL